MKNLTRQQFEEFTKHGSVRKPIGQTPIGEELAETALEFGLVNGYSLADICHFYAHMHRRQNGHHEVKLTDFEVLDTAYEHFVHDAVHFAGTVIAAAPKGRKRAVAKQTIAKKGTRPRAKK